MSKRHDEKKQSEVVFFQ